MEKRSRILIVDDMPINIKVLSDTLKKEFDVSAATSGAEALELVSQNKTDLILLDIIMPEMDGYDVLSCLKSNPETKHIPVLFVSAMGDPNDEMHGLSLGAVDYITKPISPSIVRARVRSHLKLYHYQQHLEELVRERTEQIRSSYVDTVHRLTLASEYKDEETGAHIKRISYYTKEISIQMGMDTEFAETIFYASPMHDIGKVAIPDAVLLKPGPLNDEEWAIMKTHAQIGADILKGSNSPYLKMAVDIAGCHHERWDGKGYPNGFKEDQIPLTARIMNISDQYDALRSKRPYKPSFSHEKSVGIITKGDGRTEPEHFDPEVLSAFEIIKERFNDIYESYQD